MRTHTPEPADFMDALALGLPPPAHCAMQTFAQAAGGGAAALPESYALARQVADMAAGFTVHTGYGDIVVAPGRLANRLQALVREDLERELAALRAGA